MVLHNNQHRKSKLQRAASGLCCLLRPVIPNEPSLQTSSTESALPIRSSCLFTQAPAAAGESRCAQINKHVCDWILARLRYITMASSTPQIQIHKKNSLSSSRATSSGAFASWNVFQLGFSLVRGALINSHVDIRRDLFRHPNAVAPAVLVEAAWHAAPDLFSAVLAAFFSYGVVFQSNTITININNNTSKDNINNYDGENWTAACSSYSSEVKELLAPRTTVGQAAWALHDVIARLTQDLFLQLEALPIVPGEASEGGEEAWCGMLAPLANLTSMLAFLSFFTSPTTLERPLDASSSSFGSSPGLLNEQETVAMGMGMGAGAGEGERRNAYTLPSFHLLFTESSETFRHDEDVNNNNNSNHRRGLEGLIRTAFQRLVTALAPWELSWALVGHPTHLQALRIALESFPLALLQSFALLQRLLTHFPVLQAGVLRGRATDVSLFPVSQMIESGVLERMVEGPSPGRRVQGLAFPTTYPCLALRSAAAPTTSPGVRSPTLPRSKPTEKAKPQGMISPLARPFSRPRRPASGVIGLINLGNTCFFNSVTQLFFRATRFKRALVRDVLAGVCQRLGQSRTPALGGAGFSLSSVSLSPIAVLSRPGQPLRWALGLLLAEMHWRLARGYTLGGVNPSVLWRTLPPRFADGHQHDAAELAKVMLEQLDTVTDAVGTLSSRTPMRRNEPAKELATFKELNPTQDSNRRNDLNPSGELNRFSPPPPPNALKDTDPTQSRESSSSHSAQPVPTLSKIKSAAAEVTPPATLVSQWFGGEWLTGLECLSCHQTRSQRSPFWDFTIPIPSHEKEPQGRLHAREGREAAVTVSSLAAPPHRGSSAPSLSSLLLFPASSSSSSSSSSGSSSGGAKTFRPAPRRGRRVQVHTPHAGLRAVTVYGNPTDAAVRSSTPSNDTPMPKSKATLGDLVEGSGLPRSGMNNNNIHNNNNNHNNNPSAHLLHSYSRRRKRWMLQCLFDRVAHPSHNVELFESLDCPTCGRRTPTRVSNCVVGATPPYLTLQLNRFAFPTEMRASGGEGAEGYVKLLDPVVLNEVLMLSCFSPARGRTRAAQRPIPSSNNTPTGRNTHPRLNSNFLTHTNLNLNSEGAITAAEAVDLPEQHEQPEGEEEVEVRVFYRLRGFITHSGSTPHSGHYFTLVKQPNPHENEKQENEKAPAERDNAELRAWLARVEANLSGAPVPVTSNGNGFIFNSSAPGSAFLEDVPGAATSSFTRNWVLLNDAVVRSMSSKRMRGVLTGSRGVYAGEETPYVILYEKIAERKLKEAEICFTNESNSEGMEEMLQGGLPPALEEFFLRNVPPQGGALGAGFSSSKSGLTDVDAMEALQQHLLPTSITASEEEQEELGGGHTTSIRRGDFLPPEFLGRPLP